ncbi:cytochrome P450 [Panaeolus papilionaceus]|nr:cytochrome P450 [Panaeolus papilionaceus]
MQWLSFNIDNVPLKGITLTHVACIMTLALLYHRHHASDSRKLSHIPSIGFSIPVFSLFSALKLLFYAKDMITEGVKRHHTIFKVPEFHSWMVVAGDRESMEDIRKAPEHVLSSAAFLDELTLAPYTFGAKTIYVTYHLPILHGIFTKSIPTLFPEIYAEVCDSFLEGVPLTEVFYFQEWTPISVQSTIMHIVARMSNRIFVGKPCCQNKEYIENLVGFAVDTVKVAIILRPFPSFIKPIISYFVSSIPQRKKKIQEFFVPLFEAHRKKVKAEGPDYSGKRMDYLTWLMDAAEGEDARDDELTSMLLLGTFGATFSTTTTVTMVIHYLAAYPEYMKLIRNEVAEVTSQLGWTKEALDEMVITDSFIRETQRLHPGLLLALTRKAMEDFTFSNGVTIPKGTTLSASAITQHMDESIYPSPHIFDPLRFVKMASDPASKKDHNITTIGMDLLVFGYGRHACPGRFFAAAEMKLILAHLVTHYDMKFENEGVRPDDMRISFAILPNPFTKVLLRKRQV